MPRKQSPRRTNPPCGSPVCGIAHPPPKIFFNYTYFIEGPCGSTLVSFPEACRQYFPRNPPESSHALESSSNGEIKIEFFGGGWAISHTFTGKITSPRYVGGVPESSHTLESRASFNFPEESCASFNFNALADRTSVALRLKLNEARDLEKISLF